MEHVVRCLSAAGAGHELHDDCGIARNMFCEVGDHRPGAPLSRSAGRAAADECDRLALIERRLGEYQSWSELKDDQRAEGRKPKRAVLLSHISPFGYTKENLGSSLL